MRSAFLLFALAMLGGACGDDDSSSDGGSPPPDVVASDAAGRDVGVDATGFDSDVSESDVGDVPVEPTSFRSLRMPSQPPFERGPREGTLAAECEALPLETSDAIRDAIANAADGACLRVAAGEYDLGAVTMSAANVTLASQPGADVVFLGATHIRLEGDGAVLEGIEFRQGDAREEDVSGIHVEADDVHLSHLTFRSWGSERPEGESTRCINIHYAANRLEVSDSLFTDLYGMTMIQPQRAGTDFVSAKGIWIHHNTWVDNPRRAFSNGGETIQLGTAWAYGQGQPGESEDYDDSPEMIFEHNLIRRHDLEGEIIGLKSSQNVVRYNHFDDCEGAIVVRMGLSNLIYANWMSDVDIRAVRISGERNVVAYNYFAHKEGESLGGVAVSLHSEDRRESSNPQNVNQYWAATDNIVARNIITGFDVLVDGAQQRYEVFETPNGNRIEHNYLLGMESNYRDTHEHQSDAEFRAANALQSNYELRESGEGWESPEEIDPGTGVDVSDQALLWDGGEVTPPAWWAAIDFAP